MRVTLAAPFGANQVDETVDLPRKTARRLLSDGKARLPLPDAEPSPEPVEPPAAMTAWGGHVIKSDTPRHDSGTGREEES